LDYCYFPCPSPCEIYTLSLHDALPILEPALVVVQGQRVDDVARDRQRRRQDLLQVIGDRHDVPKRKHGGDANGAPHDFTRAFPRSEEHTSELQSRGHLVCRLLLEKKKK